MAATVSAGADRGETLIEVIVSVVILGLAVTAIMGGVATSVKMSDIQRKQATAAAAVRDYAEAIESYVASGSGHYVACAGSAGYAPAAFTAPTGFTPSASAAQSWNGTTWGTCATDNGYQMITLTVGSTDGRASETLRVILRKPCRTTDATCT
jgi:Tfp pilus assembly protein PilV